MPDAEDQVNEEQRMELRRAISEARRSAMRHKPYDGRPRSRSDKPKCVATTGDAKQCSYVAVLGDYCGIHARMLGDARTQ